MPSFSVVQMAELQMLEVCQVSVPVQGNYSWMSQMKKTAAGKRSCKFPDGDLVGSLHSSSNYNELTIFSPGRV